MTAATLFGVTLAPLFAALAQVESGNGKTSQNIYQITERFVDDVNRISTEEKFVYSDRYDRKRSERMMEIYLAHYCVQYTDETGRLPTWETMARIHNGGPKGAEKRSTIDYGARVWEALARIRLEARHA